MNNNNLTITLSPGPTAPATRGTVYIPVVLTPPVDPAAEFGCLLVADPRQERTQLTHCPRLATAALWRAFGLAHGEPFSHVDSSGNGANVYARRAGCVLPSDYSPKGNEIESLCAGTAAPGVVFGALAGSKKHSDHLFGRGWFRHQTHFGVAVCENEAAPYRWYWCVLLALCLPTSGE